MKRAFITGITGQDGSYLTEFLLEKGYEVFGLVRRVSTFNRRRLTFNDRFTENHLFYGDVADLTSIIKVLKQVRPDEIYNLAAQGHAGISFVEPIHTLETTGLGIMNILEAVVALNLSPKIFQASSVEIFSGEPQHQPQNEETPFKPMNPYGAAKLYAHEIARIYRDSYSLFVARGIMSNHESIRRARNYVPRKITAGVVDIYKGRAKTLALGNLETKRDFGYVPDFVKGMWLMLQQDKPDDFCLGTGETHSIRELCEKAFDKVGLDYRNYVTLDPQYLRPLDPETYVVDYSKAREILGWEPEVKFEKLVELLMKEELENDGKDTY